MPGSTPAPAAQTLITRWFPDIPSTRGPARVKAAHEEGAEEDLPVEWSEQDIVLLHWRLLLEVRRLADPATPLEEKYDTLRWVFTERDKDFRPFSFANCLRVVGCSPLSPLPFFGRLDAEELRDVIRASVKDWLGQTLCRYPSWVQEAVAANPGWIEANLARNPQWVNEQVKRAANDGDLFA